MTVKNRTTHLMVMMPEDMVEEIEEYKSDNRHRTRSETIRKLIQIGLEDSEE